VNQQTYPNWKCYLYLLVNLFCNVTEEDLLCCKYLGSEIAGAEMFNFLDNYKKEFEIRWRNCLDMRIDGIKSVIEKT
jgi:hypothetical protein